MVAVVVEVNENHPWMSCVCILTYANNNTKNGDLQVIIEKRALYMYEFLRVLLLYGCIVSRENSNIPCFAWCSIDTHANTQ